MGSEAPPANCRGSSTQQGIMEAEEPATFCEYMFHYLNSALCLRLHHPWQCFLCFRSNILHTFFKFAGVLGDLPVHIGILGNFFDLILNLCCIIVYKDFRKFGLIIYKLFSGVLLTWYQGYVLCMLLKL